MIAESIVITRTAKRLVSCALYDRHGDELCELPLTGFVIDHGVTPSAEHQTLLRIHSFRVNVIDVDPDDENYLAIPQGQKGGTQ